MSDNLYQYQDEKYKAFALKLLPQNTKMLGVRLPIVRRIAKQLVRGNWRTFWYDMPTEYLEEKMLKGFIIAYASMDFEERLKFIAEYVPIIDNWSVCDSFCASFRFTAEEKNKLWCFLQSYFSAPQEYARRFALVMGLNHFVADEFIEELLAHIVVMKADEYYVQMAAAWALSVIYVCYPQKITEILFSKILTRNVHNKTIQKIRESLRVSKEEKTKLQLLRR